jgi:hypothetical protein
MTTDSEENNGLLDDDPALDFVLYREMERENKRPGSKSGCLAGVLLFILPIGNLLYFLTKL